jgi:hypothetical protein
VLCRWRAIFEAEWLMTITAAAPDLGAVERMILARLYATLDADAAKDSDRARQSDRIASDAFLAFTPWRSPEAA